MPFLGFDVPRIKEWCLESMCICKLVRQARRVNEETANSFHFYICCDTYNDITGRKQTY